MWEVDATMNRPDEVEPTWDTHVPASGIRRAPEMCLIIAVLTGKREEALYGSRERPVMPHVRLALYGVPRRAFADLPMRG